MSCLSHRLLSSAAVLLVMAAEASAQTCATAPSCSELGYTKSVSDCAGKSILYCPFDKTQVHCVDDTGCASLGFTDKISECPGTYSVCPSDANKGKCDFEASPGDLKYSLRTSDHNGWLLCNGRTYSSTQYPELYAAISGSFNSNLPNYSGYFLKAAATSSASTFKTAGQAGLPNLTGSFRGFVSNINTYSVSGVFSGSSNSNVHKDATSNKNNGWWGENGQISFDASRQNSIYGRSSTVTPQNYSANVFIYAGRKKRHPADLSCTRGDFYLSDGTCYSSAAGETVLGVVYAFSSTSTEKKLTIIFGGDSTAASPEAADQACKSNGGYLPPGLTPPILQTVTASNSRIPTSSTSVYPTNPSRKYYNGKTGNGYVTCTPRCTVSEAGTGIVQSNLYYYCIKDMTFAK